MERSIEHAARGVERVLRIAARSPAVLKQMTETGSFTSQRSMATGLKHYLERLGGYPIDELTIDNEGSETKITLYQSALDRQGQKVGITLILTLERR